MLILLSFLYFHLNPNAVLLEPKQQRFIVERLDKLPIAIAASFIDENSLIIALVHLSIWYTILLFLVSSKGLTTLKIFLVSLLYFHKKLYAECILPLQHKFMQTYEPRTYFPASVSDGKVLI